MLKQSDDKQLTDAVFDACHASCGGDHFCFQGFLEATFERGYRVVPTPGTPASVDPDIFMMALVDSYSEAYIDQWEGWDEQTGEETVVPGWLQDSTFVAACNDRGISFERVPA